jgi:hypothetical protein
MGEGLHANGRWSLQSMEAISVWEGAFKYERAKTLECFIRNLNTYQNLFSES